MTNHITFGKDPHSYNIDDPEENDDSDGSGNIGAGLLANAVSVWSFLNPDKHTGDAARAFNCSEANIIEAVEKQGGLYFYIGAQLSCGSFALEHDGE
ncbi:MAG: hypothetical protein ACAH80_13635 [Alphaproteobacteria bacterium]